MDDDTGHGGADPARRDLLRSGLLLAGLAAAAPRAGASPADPSPVPATGPASFVPDANADPRRSFDYARPEDNLYALSRMWGVTEPGALAHLYVFGPAFAMLDSEHFRPLFRIESIAAVRTYPQPGGAYRYLAGQVILFTDWHTGEVLQTFRNPLNDRLCEVFHYRDCPLDYTLDPHRLAERYTMASTTASDDELPRRLVLDWSFRGDMAYGDAIVKTRLKSRLDPQTWRLESPGEWWETFESYRWQAKRAEIESRATTDIPSFTGDFQTWKPWEPWLLMGQARGKIFSQRTAFKLKSFDPVPRGVMAYVEKHFADCLDVGTTFHGRYKLNDQWFRESRKPVSP